jgi:SAM-dependent methyltransferase
MAVITHLKTELLKGAVCPTCRSPLIVAESRVECSNADCGARYPVVDGEPILIDEATSIFSLADYRPGDQGTSSNGGLSRYLPERGISPKAVANFDRFRRLLLDRSGRPSVLIVGGQVAGHGTQDLLGDARIDVVETDVTIGPRTQIVCDGHSLPFADESSDGVVIQAVLEHVLDPYRCVAEIHRVLKPGGLVYAETPFMAQVHAGAYDFTRFTPLGHRRLFRMFEETASGACIGPAAALAWSYEYLLASVPRSRRGRQVSTVIGRLTSWWLKYLDLVLIDRPGALDAAFGVYFLGTKADTALSDRELVRQYRGGQGVDFVGAQYPLLS